MALIAKVNLEYAYQIQDLGSLLEQVNVSPTTDVRDRSIIAAVNYYTRRLPRVKAALISAISTGFYPVPSDWLDISRIIALEFPINLPTPMYYTPEGGWSIHLREDDGLVYIPNPNPSGQFRLVYTAAHGATAALPSETLVGSIPSAHEAIIGGLAVEQSLREFANRMAGSVMSNVDSVDYRSKSKDFTEAANNLRDKYDVEMTRAELAMLQRGDPSTYFQGWK